MQSHTPAFRNPKSLVKCKAKAKAIHSLWKQSGDTTVWMTGCPTKLEKVLAAPGIRSAASRETFCKEPPSHLTAGLSCFLLRTRSSGDPP